MPGTRPRLGLQNRGSITNTCRTRPKYEPGALSGAERRRLEAKGHRLHEIRDGYGNMQAIYWDRLQNKVRAASDPRGVGKAEVR